VPAKSVAAPSPANVANPVSVAPVNPAPSAANNSGPNNAPPTARAPTVYQPPGIFSFTASSTCAAAFPTGSITASLITSPARSTTSTTGLNICPMNPPQHPIRAPLSLSKGLDPD